MAFGCAGSRRSYLSPLYLPYISPISPYIPLYLPNLRVRGVEQLVSVDEVGEDVDGRPVRLGRGGGRVAPCAIFMRGACISPVSPLYLPCISPVSPLYLPCISPTSPLYLAPSS